MSYFSLSPKSIELDFIARSRRPSWLGGCVLALACLTIASVFVDHQDRVSKLDHANLRLERDRARNDKDIANQSEQPPARIADSVLASLTPIAQRMSHDDLAYLLDIEEATDDTVGILSLAITQDKSHATLSAQARDLSAAFAFAKRLASRPQMRTAQVTGYEFKQVGSVQAVAFNLVADWRVLP